MTDTGYGPDQLSPRMREHIQKLLDAAPPLSPAQRTRIRSLLDFAAPEITEAFEARRSA